MAQLTEMRLSFNVTGILPQNSINVIESLLNAENYKMLIHAFDGISMLPLLVKL